MWIFTPDVAYDTDHFRSIWTCGGTDTFLHLLSDSTGDEEFIRFDSPVSAVRAFDAVMNGLSTGRRSVYLEEIRTPGGSVRLNVEYDKDDYCTSLEDIGEQAVISDPRDRGMRLITIVGGTKS